MAYRTKTYLAGDWTGDSDLIQQLYKWNASDYWALHFVDAHDLTQSRDTSLCCTIKSSLAERLNVSKTFVLLCNGPLSSGFYDILAIRFFIQEHKERTPDR